MPDPTPPVPPDSLESYIKDRKQENVEGSIADASTGFKAALTEASPVHSDVHSRIDALNAVIKDLGSDVAGLEAALRQLILDHGGSTDQLNGMAQKVTEDFETDVAGHTYAARRDLSRAIVEALIVKGDEKLVPEKALEKFVKGALSKDNVTFRALGKLDGFTDGVTAWLTSGAAGMGDRASLEERALNHLGALPEGVLNKDQREAFTKIGVEDRRKIVKVLFDTLEAARSLLLHRLLTNEAVNAYFGIAPIAPEMARIFNDADMTLIRSALSQGQGAEVTIDGHLIYLYKGADTYADNLAKVEAALSAGRHIVDVTIRPDSAPLFEKQKGLKGGTSLTARRVSDGKEVSVIINKDGTVSGSTLNTLGGVTEENFRADPRKFAYGFSNLTLAS